MRRTERKELWVLERKAALLQKYQLLVGGGGVPEPEPELASLARNRLGVIQRRQVSMLEKLEHDPDNMALLQQLQVSFQWKNPDFL